VKKKAKEEDIIMALKGFTFNEALSLKELLINSLRRAESSWP